MRHHHGRLSLEFVFPKIKRVDARLVSARTGRFFRSGSRAIQSTKRRTF